MRHQLFASVESREVKSLGKFSLEYYAPRLQKALALNHFCVHNKKLEFLPQYVHDKLHATYTNDASVVDRWIQTHVRGPQKLKARKKGNKDTTMIIIFDTESVPRAPWIKPSNFDGIATVQFATPKSSLVAHLTRCSRESENGTPSTPVPNHSLCPAR